MQETDARNRCKKQMQEDRCKKIEARTRNREKK
jgi:hypothetical protein